MPVITRSAPKPLPPEGPAKLLIEEATYGKSKEKKTPFFGLVLKDLASGLMLKPSLSIQEWIAYSNSERDRMRRILAVPPEDQDDLS